MKNIFVIILRYIAPLDEIEHYRNAHIKFLEEYYAQNIFIASGAQTPRTGGVILARATERAMLTKIIQEDPFYIF